MKALYVTVGVFLILISGRFIPAADALLSGFHVPISYVPSYAPWFVAVAGCWCVLHAAFKSVPE